MMNEARITFLSEAGEEYVDAVKWYATIDAKLAKRFVSAVSQTLEHMTHFPLSYSAIDARHRAALVHLFPYRIIYRVMEDAIVVVAIAHMKRKPRYFHVR
jgi:plasmid stabilization system protein ParE